jgi:hypothetical protein
MVFEGKKKVSERAGNPLRVSDSNKLGNREKFPKLKNLFQAFPSLENLFRFPSLLLSETLREFPARSETFFTLENHFWVSEIDKWVSERSGTYFGWYSRIPFFYSAQVFDHEPLFSISDR